MPSGTPLYERGQSIRFEGGHRFDKQPAQHGMSVMWYYSLRLMRTSRARDIQIADHWEPIAVLLPELF